MAEGRRTGKCPCSKRAALFTSRCAGTSSLLKKGMGIACQSLSLMDLQALNVCGISRPHKLP